GGYVERRARERASPRVEAGCDAEELEGQADQVELDRKGGPKERDRSAGVRDLDGEEDARRRIDDRRVRALRELPADDPRPGVAGRVAPHETDQVVKRV